MSYWSRAADSWKKTREHWKEQYRKHKPYYEAAGIVGLTMVAGPGASGAVVGATHATRVANDRKRAQESLMAAASQRTQDPASFDRDVTAGGEFGVAVTPGMKELIPMVFIIGLVAYVVFKA